MNCVTPLSLYIYRLVIATIKRQFVFHSRGENFQSLVDSL